MALGAIPVSHFLAGLFEVRILRQDGFVAVRTRRRVVVGGRAEEFDILALVADRFDPLLRTECGALGVVRNELRLGEAFLVDLGIDEDDRDAGRNRLLDRTDRTVGICRVEDDGDRLVGDGGVDQVAFGVGVTLVGADIGRIAEALGRLLGNFALREPVGVRRVVDDDGDQAFGPGRAEQQRHDGRSSEEYTHTFFEHGLTPFVEFGCADFRQYFPLPGHWMVRLSR